MIECHVSKQNLGMYENIRGIGNTPNLGTVHDDRTMLSFP